MTVGPWLAIATGFAVAYLNGANDVSKGVATLAGSNITDYRRAIRWGALWTGAGGLASSVLSKTLIGTFGAGLLAQQGAPTLIETLAVLLGVAACVGLATRLGLPVSTTHAIVGSVAGVYSFSLGVAGVNWGALAGKVVLPLLVSPVLALGLVVAALRAERLITRRLAKAPECLCVDIGPAFIPAGLAGTGSALALAQAPQVHVSVGSQKGCATGRPAAFRVTSTHLHWLTSGATNFARGLNDTPKIAALLLLTLAASRGIPMPKSSVFAVVALGIAAGSWIAGKKVAKFLAEKVTPMDHQEGFIANLVTAGLVGPGAALGWPMSTTHVSSGAIVGVGVPKKAGLNWETVQSMVLAWSVTIPLAGLLGVSAFLLLRLAYAT